MLPLRVITVTFVTLLPAILAVHYLEERLLPVVEIARSMLYGEQIDAPARQGCDALPQTKKWVHPTALALTVYGDAQAILNEKYGMHEPEVLPKYAGVRKDNRELLCVADYLLASSEVGVIGSLKVRAFPFDVPYARYDLRAGWLSGLTQGMVGQIFLAAYSVNGAAEYLEAARHAGNLLTVTIDSGGVLIETDHGDAWFEEYAQSGKTPPLVLNGHLLALDFLYRIRQVDSSRSWRNLFDSGVRATVEYVGRYEGRAWSYYDQRSNLATRKYHAFHVRQLERYAQYDDSGTLERAGSRMRWQLYVPAGIFQRLITQPSKLLAFETGLMFIVLFPIVWFASRNLAQFRRKRGTCARGGSRKLE